MNSVALKLKPGVGAKVDIGQGEYRRQFLRSDEPFLVGEQEADLLLKTGVFQRAEKPGSEPQKAQPDPEPAPAAETSRRSTRREKE